MDHCIGILAVERDGEDGLIVKFSDGTVTGYVTEELLELRPYREPVEGACADGAIALGGTMLADGLLAS